MIRWIPYTFVRTTFFFIAGILLAVHLPGFIDVFYAGVLLAFSIAAFIVGFVVRQYKTLETSWFGLPGFFSIFLLGYLHLTTQTETNDPIHLSHFKDVNAYEVILSGYNEEKEKTWKITGEVQSVRTDSAWERASGNLLLYFRKSDFPQPFVYGDRLVISGSPQNVPPPGNPNEFDYRKFLAYKNIYQQHFPSAANVGWLGNDPSSLIKYYAYNAREWANSILDKYVPGERERGVASALVLGVTDGLDHEILRSYSATGAMHVLAVSGLHISILYMIILWILKPISTSRSGKLIVAVVSLLVLWGYSFITGLSPSVLRAVTMFSFLVVAKSFSRDSNIYNTLAVSCFVLLLFDPFLIMSVGFQLSYLAVLGIVHIYPMIYHKWEVRSWSGDQVWKITAVSIAAQLATFSLGLFYFHQFPNYFLISNLLVIPASFVVLIAGIFLIAVSFIKFLAVIAGYVVWFGIAVMNYSVQVVEWLPYSLLENIWITPFQCWLLMALVIMFIVFFDRKKIIYLQAAFILCCAFSFLQWRSFLEREDDQILTVYKVPGHSMLDIISQGKAHVLADSILANAEDKISFHVKPNWIAAAATPVFVNVNSLGGQFNGAQFMNWNDQSTLCIIDKEYKDADLNMADIIVIRNNAVRKLSDLRLPAASIVIFDSSNSYGYSRKLQQQSRELKIPAHFVLLDGAFQYNLKSKSFSL